MVKAKKQTSKLKKKAHGFATSHTDFLYAILIVSLLVNLFVLIGWVTLQVTDKYDSQVAEFLFSSYNAE